MLAAEGAILVSLEFFGRIFLVLHGVVVPLLALAASQGDLDPRTCFRHFFGTSLFYFRARFPHANASLYGPRRAKKDTSRPTGEQILSQQPEEVKEKTKEISRFFPSFC
jgi:hypothetical protein